MAIQGNTPISAYLGQLQNVDAISPQNKRIPMPPARRQSASQMPRRLNKPNTVGQLLSKLKGVKKATPMTPATGGFKNLPVMAGAPKKSFGDLQREAIQRAILANFNVYGE